MTAPAPTWAPSPTCTVLASLEQRHDHPSAEKIYQEVRRQLPAISFNTVYKTLEILCQKGLVNKVNPLHEAARSRR